MTAPAAVSQREAFGTALLELVGEDSRVLVLDGDLANSTRTDIVALGRPEQFLMMGIAEQNMIGVAAGLATLGFVPWCVSFAAFIANRDLDQVRVVVAQPRLNVKLAGAYSGLLTGKTGKTHQDVSDIATMRAIPHMTVLAPGDAVEVKAALRAATEFMGPVYLRLTRDPTPAIHAPPFTIGPAITLRQGRDVGVISTGDQTARALAAADLLAVEGIECTVLHVPTIKPLDEERVIEVARSTGRLVVTEDHSIIGGLGSAVAEVLGEHHPTPMRRVGMRDTFGESGPNDALLEKYGLSVRHIVAAVLDVARL